MRLVLGEPGKWEPEARHALAETRRGEQAFHQPDVAVGTIIGKKRVQLVGSRRQARQIKRKAPNQSSLVRLRRRRNAGLFESSQYEIIDWLQRPIDMSNDRLRLTQWRLK